MQRFQLGAQLPFQRGIDDGQRFVEQDRGDVRAHEAAAERNLLLGVRRQAARARGRDRARSSRSAISRDALVDFGALERRGFSREKRDSRRTVIVS